MVSSCFRMMSSELCSSHCCGQCDVEIGLTIVSGGLCDAGISM